VKIEEEDEEREVNWRKTMMKVC